MLDFRQFPPLPLPGLHAKQSVSKQPAVAVGLDFCTIDFIDFPPVSKILNSTPASASSSAICLSAFASSPLGVGGTKIGATFPPLVDQD